MPVNQTDSLSATGFVKRAPMGREPIVISFGKAARVLNRGNGRVALVKALLVHSKQWPCSKREYGHRSQ